MSTYLLGFDVSLWQEQVDFSAAKQAGMQYVFIKASESSFPDPRFVQHWRNSVGVLPRGAYHYFRHGISGKQQAQKFYEVVKATGDLGELPPVLDVEEPDTPIKPAEVKACLEETKRLFGRTPLVYTRASWWNTKIGPTTWAGEYGLWIAHYPFYGWFSTLIQHVAQWLTPALPLGWQTWDFWQFTDKGPAKSYGVSGYRLDLDFTTQATLDRLTGGSVPDPDPGDEAIMKFKTRKTYNIRSVPGTPAGSDVGDIPAGEIITAQEIRFTDSNSGWVRIFPDPAWLSKTSPTNEYWIAGIHDGQGPFLDFVL